jgi:bifunctional non-homologous end joining protein LigD
MKPTPAATDRRSRTIASRPNVAGIAISHPERLIFPELGISKIDLARYYEEIAD